MLRLSEPLQLPPQPLVYLAEVTLLAEQIFVQLGRLDELGIELVVLLLEEGAVHRIVGWDEPFAKSAFAALHCEEGPRVVSDADQVLPDVLYGGEDNEDPAFRVQLATLFLGEIASQGLDALPLLLLAHGHVPVFLDLEEPHPFLDVRFHGIDENNCLLVPPGQLRTIG